MSTQIDIEETANKLRQLGVKLRLKGNDADKRRILQKHCDDHSLEPVLQSIPANRIWLELDPPATNEVGHIRAAALTAMLKRLGLDHGPNRNACWWNERKQRYCFTLDASGTFVEANDHGHWYSLDFLSTTPETT